jgi:hypothetical protein
MISGPPGLSQGTRHNLLGENALRFRPRLRA